LFGNQWNEKTTNLRLFNWYQVIYPNTRIKEGYYLELTDEIRNIILGNKKCNWCGETINIDEIVCTKCGKSDYLRLMEL